MLSLFKDSKKTLYIVAYPLILDYDKQEEFKELVIMMNTKRKSEQTISLHPSLASMKIIKRDGRLVDFDDQKIYDALVKAKHQISGELSPLDHEQILKIVEKIDLEIVHRFTENIKIKKYQDL